MSKWKCISCMPACSVETGTGTTPCPTGCIYEKSGHSVEWVKEEALTCGTIFPLNPALSFWHEPCVINPIKVDETKKENGMIETLKNDIGHAKRALKDCNSKITTYQKKLAYIKSNPDEVRINDLDVDYEFDVADKEMGESIKGTFKGDLRVLQIIFEANMLPLQEQAKEHETALVELKAQLSKEVAALTEGIDI